MLMLKKLIAFN